MEDLLWTSSTKAQQKHILSRDKLSVILFLKNLKLSRFVDAFTGSAKGTLTESAWLTSHFSDNFISAVRTEISKCFQKCEKYQPNGTTGAPAALLFTAFF